MSSVYYVKSTVLGAKWGITMMYMPSSLESKTVVGEKTCMQITVIKSLDCRYDSNKVLPKFREGIRKRIIQDVAFVWEVVTAYWGWNGGHIMARNWGWYQNMKNLGYHNREFGSSRNQSFAIDEMLAAPAAIGHSSLFPGDFWLTEFSLPSPAIFILGDFICPQWTTFPIHWSLYFLIFINPPLQLPTFMSTLWTLPLPKTVSS